MTDTVTPLLDCVELFLADSKRLFAYNVLAGFCRRDNGHMVVPARGTNADNIYILAGKQLLFVSESFCAVAPCELFRRIVNNVANADKLGFRGQFKHRIGMKIGYDTASDNAESVFFQNKYAPLRKKQAKLLKYFPAILANPGRFVKKT